MGNSDQKNICFISVGTVASVLLVLLSLAVVGMINTASAATWYVSTDGDDDYGGTGWVDAFATIQRGIDEAENGDTVLVDDGTYTGEGNKNINLYYEIEVRSVNGPNSCIIDLENDGKGFYLLGPPVGSVIDGFTIMNGHPASDLDYGVGIECYGCFTTISNCIIKNNSGVQWGAGIRISGSGTHPVIVNTIFSGNHTTTGGSAVSIYQASATFINCTFSGNTSFNSVIAATIPTSITNSIVWNNNPGAITGNAGGIPNVTYSDVEGGYTGTGNISNDPEFIDPGNQDFRLSSTTACIDAGKNDTPSITEHDIDGKPRFIDGDDDMDAIVDMGAYEFGDIGECDFNEDLDVDGEDLAAFINDSAGYTLVNVVEDFGRNDCPLYSYIP